MLVLITNILVLTIKKKVHTFSPTLYAELYEALDDELKLLQLLTMCWIKLKSVLASDSI